MTAPEDLDSAVRTGDPDRWLASRFAAAPARSGLAALYAFNLEVARVADTVSTAMLGDIRLAWWREGIEAMAGGGAVRDHPVLQGLAAAGPLDTGALERVIEARAKDLEPAPFADEPALVDYIDATAGALMTAAARLLDPAARPENLVSAARAWGWASLWRAGVALAERGRRWTPLAWGDAGEDEIAPHVRRRVFEALEAARSELADLPVAAFPAVAYAGLAGPYARGRHPTDLEKRARLVAAVVRGRV
jgi:phytoene synthase